MSADELPHPAAESDLSARPVPPPPMEELRAAARAASARAYAPYSGFRVGAAVWTDRGLFTGCNVENASHGLTNCAERGAIFAAVSAGARVLTCVAIHTPTAGATAPCGACRQVIHEFGPSARVLAFGDGDDVLDTTLAELLPHAFGPRDLGIDPATRGRTENKQ